MKHRDDRDDAFWLAHLMRLDILPTGYIYPKKERAIRDLLRKRLFLVRQQTMNILSIQNQLTRLTGQRFSCNEVKRFKAERLRELIVDTNNQLALVCQFNIINSLKYQINVIESTIVKQIKLKDAYKKLLNIRGIGVILALTIT